MSVATMSAQSLREREKAAKRAEKERQKRIAQGQGGRMPARSRNE
ncbi:hypothetical protein [Bifidobacterium aerophilum]|nr:hypothetical protein [Bifidobacterium aerophilum]